MQSAPALATRPGGNDYALILGVVGRGTGVAGAGAEERARAFLDWLIAPTGGGLPGNHVHALVGHDHDIGKASLRQMLYELIPDLDKRLESGGTAGRRCYLYLSGAAVQLPNELRLIARDKASRPRLLDASFQRFVGYLRTTRVFDEVVAFADVELADIEVRATPQDPVFPSSEPVPRGIPAPAFAAVSAPSKAQRTKKLPATRPTTDLVSYFGFTGAIIEGLTNGARDEGGAITAESFVRWAGPRLQKWLGEAGQMPRFEYDTRPPFVFFDAPPATVDAEAESAAPGTPVRMPNAYALLIGVDDYVSIPRLWGCADDARALARALGPEGAGYDESHIGVLTDRDATREIVTSAFGALASQCDSESTVFIWFSGRAHVEGGQTTIFLADDTLDAPTSGMSAAQITALLDSLPARRVALVIDTSGGCAGIAPKPGRILLSATLPAEDAYSGTGTASPGGDFTRAIRRALEGGAASDAGGVSVFDVFEYAHAEVVRLGRQHPTIGMAWGEVGFQLAERPLVSSTPPVTAADGFAYDVHVVHSHTSPRASFVEHVLLPALVSAGLRVAVSAPLETSPVARVVQIERGIRRSRRTLLLETRGSSRDAGFTDVLRLAVGTRPPLLDPGALVIVALDEQSKSSTSRQVSTADGDTVFVDIEPFDLISADIGANDAGQRLIDRLRAPLEPAATDAGETARAAEPNVPLVEVTEEPDREPEGLVLSVDESRRLLELTLSKDAKRVSVATIMHKGDIVFLRDPDGGVDIVGVSRVLRAFRPVASTVVTAGRPRPYDFELPIRLTSPVDMVTSTESVAVAAAAVCLSAVQHGAAPERDGVLQLLAPFLEQQALADLLDVARSISDPVDRGSALRSVVWHARRGAPSTLLAVNDNLGLDPEPSVRALIGELGDQAAPFTNACFFDATLESNRLVKIGGALGIQLQRWRAEPVYVHERALEPFDSVVHTMSQSACIALAWSSHTASDPEWLELMREAVEIDNRRTTHFEKAGLTAPPLTLVILVADSPDTVPAELARRRTIDITQLISGSDDAVIARVTGDLLDAVLASCQLMIENPPAAPPSITREEALDRIDIQVGDLLESEHDAIVNPIGATATSTGEIGVQLLERIGDSMLSTLERHYTLVAGETRVGLSAGRIPARYIIHTCTEDAPRGNTVDGIVVGVLGALRTANLLPSVRRLALPALGSGAVGLAPGDVARAVLPAIVKQLARGSLLARVTFVMRSQSAAAAYREELQDLATSVVGTRSPATAANAARWYVSLRQATVGSVYVGGTTSLGLVFSQEEEPNAVPLMVPYSAFELTAYVDATAAFSLDGSSQQTVQVRDGYIDKPSVSLRLLALASGTHTVRVTVNARGALTAGTDAVVTCPVTVEATFLLPDIPELIDRRAIPAPQPDVVLYVATEPTARSQRLRLHITCPALGYDRRRIEQVLHLDSADTVAIRIAAAEVAAELDPSSPPDARAAILGFGAMLYDVLAPPGHELRAIMGRLLALPPRGDRPVTWLVVSDEAAALPWELVVPHGYSADATHWYDECLATRFVIAHWISRRGFEMPNEAPVGPLGVVHYGQHPEAHARWREAIGADLASDADRHLGLDILKRGSPYFGVHLLRFTDASEAGRIAEATDARRTDGTGDPLTGDRRLDFTLRRPLVSLSLVDASLERGSSAASRHANIEQAWAVPFLLARSSAVVGPRWTTAPSSDRVFFRAFYDAVRADRPLGLAVWEARETLRLAYPDRADWLAYTYFGHPWCEPYPVETAEGFTLFEPMGLTADQPFVAGRDYLFRASFRGELPAWYNGRRHMRTTRLRGEGVTVLVAPLHGGDPTSYELIAASGADAGPDDDVYTPVILSMPKEAGTHKWFVQFTRGGNELRSSVITVDVVDDAAALEMRLAERERQREVVI